MEKSIAEAVFIRGILEKILGKKEKEVRLVVTPTADPFSTRYRDVRQETFTEQSLLEGDVHEINRCDGKGMIANSLMKKTVDSLPLI